MLTTITVPSKDYKAIEQWLKRGRVLMPEIIGRSYEVSGDGFVANVEVMANQQDIHYTLIVGDEVYQKILRSPVCHFPEYGVTLAFSIDDSYE
jgi:hypothetical protein